MESFHCGLALARFRQLWIFSSFIHLAIDNQVMDPSLNTPSGHQQGNILVRRSGRVSRCSQSLSQLRLPLFNASHVGVSHHHKSLAMTSCHLPVCANLPWILLSYILLSCLLPCREWQTTYLPTVHSNEPEVPLTKDLVLLIFTEDDD